MKSKILIVEDDANIANLIRHNMEKSGFACKICDNGEIAFRMLARENFKLVILDIRLMALNCGLPSKDGTGPSKEYRLG